MDDTAKIDAVIGSGPFDYNFTTRTYHLPQCFHARRGERDRVWKENVNINTVRVAYRYRRVNGVHFCVHCFPRARHR